jgi:MFS family permease
MTDATATTSAADDAQAYPNYKRNIALLSVGWALMTTSMMMVVSVTSNVGHMLAPAGMEELLALPAALQWGAMALLTVPFSFLMRKIGRRNGFFIAALLMISSAAVAIVAIYERSFWLYCVGSFGIGGAQSIAWYYRFAAAEMVPESYRSRAISLTLAGGVAAAFVGPTLADYSREALSPVLYAGSFAAIMCVQCITLIVLLLVRIPRPKQEDLKGGRPLLEIARQPKFIIAVGGGVVGYGVMVMMMSVVPYAMELCGHTFSDATSVIQWHVLGMYIPAFFTGHLIRKFGASRIMLLGGVANVGALVTAASGIELINFYIALALVGVGWNFLYTSATSMLTETYTVAERAKAQAFNEFLVFTFVGIAVLFSGFTLKTWGWTEVNLAALPLIGIVVLGAAWASLRKRRQSV